MLLFGRNGSLLNGRFSSVFNIDGWIVGRIIWKKIWSGAVANDIAELSGNASLAVVCGSLTFGKLNWTLRTTAVLDVDLDFCWSKEVVGIGIGSGLLFSFWSVHAFIV